MKNNKRYVYENNNLAVLKIELKIIKCCYYCNMHPWQEKFILDMQNRSNNLKKFTVSEKQKSHIDRITSKHYVEHCDEGLNEGLLPDYDILLGKYL